MRPNHRSFAITWLPVMAFWALLIAIASNQQISGPPWPVALFVYIFVSAIFAYQLQSEFTSSNNDTIIVVTRANTIITCLTVSSIVIFIGLLSGYVSNILTTILVITPLIISTVIDGLASYSNEQLTVGFDKRSEERRLSISNKDSWESYLSEANKKYSSFSEVVNEIKRIRNIINYSTFFRSQRSNELLAKLKLSKQPEIIAEILREVK